MESPEKIAILLVEDDAVSRQLMRSLFEQTEKKIYSLEEAVSLNEALKKTTATRFEAVLLDLNLPDSSGLETVRTFRRKAPDIPVVVLTSNDDEETVVDSLRNGVQEYLVKGEFTPPMLMRALRTAMERKKMALALKKKAEELKVTNQIFLNQMGYL